MHNPFTTDNTIGYTQAECDRLNAEFTARWNGWDVPAAQLFFYSNGKPMSEEDAVKAFQDEIAHR